jgi:hypothetical protein
MRCLHAGSRPSGGHPSQPSHTVHHGNGRPRGQLSRVSGVQGHYEGANLPLISFKEAQSRPPGSSCHRASSRNGPELVKRCEANTHPVPHHILYTIPPYVLRHVFSGLLKLNMMACHCTFHILYSAPGPAGKKKKNVCPVPAAKPTEPPRRCQVCSHVSGDRNLGAA